MSELQKKAPSELESRGPPINSLSVELLSAIFCLGQAAERQSRDESDDEDFEVVDVPFEILVCAVSQLWRSVATTTGSLWTRIVVDKESIPDAVDTFLARSDSCRLDVCFGRWNDSVGMRRMADAVFSHSNRWRSCSIVGEVHDPSLSRIVHLAAPELECLKVTVGPLTRRIDAALSEGCHVFRGGCPQLKILHLYEFAVHCCLPPLSSIATLQLNYSETAPLQYSYFREVLIACSHSLERMSISGAVVDTSPWPHRDHAQVLIPNLLDLHISSLTGYVYSGILLAVDAPKLQSLRLEGVQQNDLDLYLRSTHRFPHLRSLSLPESALTALKVNDVCASFSSLVELRLLGFAFNPTKVLQVIYEYICDLGLNAKGGDQHSKTLATILDPDQMASLKDTLESKNMSDRLLYLEYDSTYPEFFSWLQNFVTMQSLLLASDRDV